MKSQRILLLFLLLPFGAISQSENPAAPGFRAMESDPNAIALADSVVAALGGRAAYDQTRYFYWNFFGRRTLLWDKQEGRVRIEIPSQAAIYLLDLRTMEGRVQQKGVEYTQADSLKKYLERAHAIWINDSYWLVQPFKLKDTGVLLKFIGTGSTPDNKNAFIIDMTFKAVGLTPQNRYRLYIDQASNRISHWQFYRKADDLEPAMETPYRGYQKYGNIYLSGDRGKYQLTDIEVLERVPEKAFEELGNWR